MLGVVVDEPASCPGKKPGSDRARARPSTTTATTMSARRRRRRRAVRTRDSSASKSSLVVRPPGGRYPLRYQTDAEELGRISAALAGRGFACAPGRAAAAAAELVELVLGDAEVPQPLEAGEARELLDALDRHGGHRSRDDRRVEPHRRRQAERVHRSVRKPVAAADRLRHRVGEVQPVRGERLARVACRLEKARPRLEVAAVLEHARKPLVDRRPRLAAPPRARPGRAPRRSARAR